MKLSVQLYLTVPKNENDKHEFNMKLVGSLVSLSVTFIQLHCCRKGTKHEAHSETGRQTDGSEEVVLRLVRLIL